MPSDFLIRFAMAHSSGGRLAGRPVWWLDVSSNRKNAPFLYFHTNRDTAAAGDTSKWWWPNAFGFWPPGVPRQVALPAFIQAYETLGFSVCQDGSLEAGFEKVALYVDMNGLPTHATRQLITGKWTRKLGKEFDIEHLDPNGVSGTHYGNASTYMRRALPT